MTRRYLGVLGLVALAACQDSLTRDVPIVGPSFHISEGRFGGGNPDFFFGSPLAATPQPGDPNFDAGASNALLVPYMRVCETDGAPNSLGCVVDVTSQVTDKATGLAMTYDPQAELYEVQWNTGQLTPTKDYRIEIWGVAFTTPAEKAALDPRWLFGWRDIRDHGIDADCDGPQLFCLIDFGQILPVRARIEEFVFCPLTKNCAVQFIKAGQDANLEAQLPFGSAAPTAQVFVPGQTGTDFALAFEPCTAAEDAALINAIDAPTFGPCLKTLTQFTGQLNTPAIVSLCGDLDTSPWGLSHLQEHQVELHHFSNDLARIQALPAALQCTTPTSGVARARPNGFLEWARAMRKGLANLVTPKPLFAVVLDRGGGGSARELASFFKLALPAKFVYSLPGDGQLTGVAGSKVVLRAKVTDLLGEPIKNARVRWKAIAPPADGATVIGVVPGGVTLTDRLGIALKNVETSKVPGVNVFHAFGRGIADSRESGCVIPPSTPAACNGPRTTFDPFMPFHVPEFDPVGNEVAVDLATGTRLLFTVVGRPR